MSSAWFHAGPTAVNILSISNGSPIHDTGIMNVYQSINQDLFIDVFCLQSSGYVVHLVPQPTQVDPIHSVAQLPLDNSEGNCFHPARHSHSTVLLQYARLHGQEDAGSVAATSTLLKPWIHSDVISPLLSWQ